MSEQLSQYFVNPPAPSKRPSEPNLSAPCDTIVLKLICPDEVLPSMLISLTALLALRLSNDGLLEEEAGEEEMYLALYLPFRTGFHLHDPHGHERWSDDLWKGEGWLWELGLSLNGGWSWKTC